MYFRGISDIEIENLVKQDKILIDKDNFLTELIIDEGKSFLGMQGYHKILEIENMKGRVWEVALFKSLNRPFIILSIYTKPNDETKIYCCNCR